MFPNHPPKVKKFQSTLPAKGATCDQVVLIFPKLFQSTLPAKGATFYWLARQIIDVSIHAPREGSDSFPWNNNPSRSSFNPRSPRRERHHATSSKMAFDVSIHAPREGSDEAFVDAVVILDVSIHAPREGSDIIDINNATVQPLFQSTLPAKGATLLAATRSSDEVVSIHAPREGSDRQPSVPSSFRAFQSTLPAKGATRRPSQRAFVSEVSIHAPREGSDAVPISHCPKVRCFNPRSPRRERLPWWGIERGGDYGFNPRSPRRERLPVCVLCLVWILFQSTLPAKGATRICLVVPM